MPKCYSNIGKFAGNRCCCFVATAKEQMLQLCEHKNKVESKVFHQNTRSHLPLTNSPEQCFSNVFDRVYNLLIVYQRRVPTLPAELN